MSGSASFSEINGQAYALGPLDAALVRAVLGAAAKMRRETRYEIVLRVKHGGVHVHVVQYLGDVEYADGD